MRVSWAAATHPGARRANNEDSYCARGDLGLFVVADGMGGHAAGEVASRLAVDSIERSVRASHHDPDHTSPVLADPALDAPRNRLRSAFVVANRRLATELTERDEVCGMATTAVALLVTDEGVAVANVGDSRAYLLRGQELTRLTRDHSWVEEQVRAGVLSEDAARQHPWRNVVTRALSGGADPEVDVEAIPIEAGDRLLLCTDGLSGVVPDDRIRDTLGSGPLQQVCDRLVTLANDAGGPDNVTVLALEFDAR
jgi:protein phosphatase